MIALLLLITMWPLVSGAKLSECHGEYPLGSLLAALALTLAGGIAWLTAVMRGMQLIVWYDSVFVSDGWFWYSFAAYAACGVLRYGAFSKYDRDHVYAHLVEEAARRRREGMK